MSRTATPMLERSYPTAHAPRAPVIVTLFEVDFRPRARPSHRLPGAQSKSRVKRLPLGQRQRLKAVDAAADKADAANVNSISDSTWAARTTQAPGATLGRVVQEGGLPHPRLTTQNKRRALACQHRCEQLCEPRRSGSRPSNEGNCDAMACVAGVRVTLRVTQGVDRDLGSWGNLRATSRLLRPSGEPTTCVSGAEASGHGSRRDLPRLGNRRSDAPPARGHRPCR